MNLYWGTVKVYGFEEDESVVLTSFVFANSEKEAKDKTKEYYDTLVENEKIRKAWVYSFYVLEETDEEVMNTIFFSPSRVTVFNYLTGKNKAIKLWDFKEMYKASKIE